VLAPTGRTLWVEREDDLDTVTALSGSGPAYFFYVVEAMIQAGLDLGLHPQQARELALATCGGAAAWRCNRAKTWRACASASPARAAPRMRRWRACAPMASARRCSARCAAATRAAELGKS
jgi:pyrroline-5-carboxylate reductase